MKYLMHPMSIVILSVLFIMGCADPQQPETGGKATYYSLGYTPDTVYHINDTQKLVVTRHNNVKEFISINKPKIISITGIGQADRGKDAYFIIIYEKAE